MRARAGSRKSQAGEVLEVHEVLPREDRGVETELAYVIDATAMVVGRLAAQIAPILMGKHRPTYTPHIDTGDYVIVTNVDKVVFTGKKWQQKSYQWYTGHPGGQKEEAAWKLFPAAPSRADLEAGHPAHDAQEQDRPAYAQ